MRGLKYLDKDVLEFSFSKNPELEDGQEIDLEINLNYGLGINAEEHQCFAEAEVIIADESCMYFELRVKVVGIFSLMNTDVNEDELNDATLKEFAPHINSLLASLAGIAGMPPVPFSYEDISGGGMGTFTESLN